MAKGLDITEKNGLIPAICPQCGAKLEINARNDKGVCPYCDTKIIIKDLKNKVKIDKSDDYKNYVLIARRARSVGDYHTALKYYDLALSIDPNSWECVFNISYLQLSFNNLIMSHSDIENYYNLCLNLIDNNFVLKEEEDDKVAAVNEVLNSVWITRFHYWTYSTAGDFCNVMEKISIKAEKMFSKYKRCRLAIVRPLKVANEVLSSKLSLSSRYHNGSPINLNELDFGDLDVRNQIKANTKFIQKYDPDYECPISTPTRKGWLIAGIVLLFLSLPFMSLNPAVGVLLFIVPGIICIVKQLKTSADDLDDSDNDSDNKPKSVKFACSNCGGMITKNDKYCPDCGCKLVFSDLDE